MWTALEVVTCERLWVSVRGWVRVRVRGSVIGYVSVEGNRRWRRGAFDESFLLHTSSRTAPIRLAALGLGGMKRMRLALPLVDLATPKLEVVKEVAPTLRGVRVLNHRIRARVDQACVQAGVAQ